MPASAETLCRIEARAAAVAAAGHPDRPANYFAYCTAFYIRLFLLPEREGAVSDREQFPDSPGPSAASGAAAPGSEEAASELIGGAILAAVGAGALYIGSSYRMGTSFNMGAGYFPRLVAGGLLLLGAVLMIRGLRAGIRSWPAMPVRPTLAILGATLAFGLSVETIGLFLASLLSVLIASAATTPETWRRPALIALVLAAMASLVFGVLLNLSLPLWPRPWTF
jgi:hypothetical protein